MVVYRPTVSHLVEAMQPRAPVCLVVQGITHNFMYRPFHMGVASRLATAIYVAMVTPILYDNSYSLND